MTAENFTGLLTTLTEFRPFRPFTVELAGGRRFEVDHAGAIIQRDGVAVYLQPGGIPVWFDHESVVSIVGDIANTTA